MPPVFPEAIFKGDPFTSAYASVQDDTRQFSRPYGSSGLPS